MKYLFILSFTLFSLLGFYACGGADQNESEDTDGTTAIEESAEDAERRALMRSEWSVEEIIEHWVNGLDERLTLSTEARSGIRNAYSNAYIDDGGSLDDIINRDEARDLRQEIVRKTEEEVLEHLTEDQVKFYTRFYDNQ